MIKMPRCNFKRYIYKIFIVVIFLALIYFCVFHLISSYLTNIGNIGNNYYSDLLYLLRQLFSLYRYLFFLLGEQNIDYEAVSECLYLINERITIINKDFNECDLKVLVTNIDNSTRISTNSTNSNTSSPFSTFWSFINYLFDMSCSFGCSIGSILTGVNNVINATLHEFKELYSFYGLDSTRNDSTTAIKDLKFDKVVCDRLKNTGVFSRYLYGDVDLYRIKFYDNNKLVRDLFFQSNEIANYKPSASIQGSSTYPNFLPKGSNLDNDSESLRILNTKWSIERLKFINSIVYKIYNTTNYYELFINIAKTERILLFDCNLKLLDTTRKLLSINCVDFFLKKGNYDVGLWNFYNVNKDVLINYLSTDQEFEKNLNKALKEYLKIITDSRKESELNESLRKVMDKVKANSSKITYISRGNFLRMFDEGKFMLLYDESWDRNAKKHMPLPSERSIYLPVIRKI